MWIKTPSDYFAALCSIAAYEDSLPTVQRLEFGAIAQARYRSTDAAAETALDAMRAVRGYLRGLDSDGVRRLEHLAPNDGALQLHRQWAMEIDNEYLANLARLTTWAKPENEAELQRAALGGALLIQQHVHNRKQRIKDQGRIVRCQMCTVAFHSADTERIKPYGSTRYGRFCKTCAQKVKQAKAIYQGMRKTRGNFN